jgi:hypothetical protein
MLIRSRLIAVILAVGVAISLAPYTIAGASTSRHAAARQYLSDIAPYTSATSVFAKDANSWGNSTTVSTMGKEAAPVIAALRGMQRDFLKQKWPKNTRADIRALYSSIGPVIGDFESISSLTPGTLSTWEGQVSRDGAITASASNLVRSDLGLPTTATS